MNKQKVYLLCSLMIIFFTIISLIMFYLDNGIVIKATSDLFNYKIISQYRAIDLIFDEPNFLGIIGLISLILGSLSLLITMLNSWRFLLSLCFFVLSCTITYLLPSIINIKRLNWGTLLTIKPIIGYPLFIALLLQIACIITNGLLFITNKKSV